MCNHRQSWNDVLRDRYYLYQEKKTQDEVFLLPVCSVHSSEHLEKERDELRASLEEALQKLQDQHQRDLLELEQRLQALYQAEWDRVQLSHQEESERSRTLLQQQVGALNHNLQH